MKFYNDRNYKEMGAAAFDSRSLKLWKRDKAIIRRKLKNSSKQQFKEFQLSDMNF